MWSKYSSILLEWVYTSLHWPCTSIRLAIAKQIEAHFECDQNIFRGFNESSIEFETFPSSLWHMRQAKHKKKEFNIHFANSLTIYSDLIPRVHAIGKFSQKLKTKEKFKLWWGKYPREKERERNIMWLCIWGGGGEFAAVVTLVWIVVNALFGEVTHCSNLKLLNQLLNVTYRSTLLKEEKRIEKESTFNFFSIPSWTTKTSPKHEKLTI